MKRFDEHSNKIFYKLGLAQLLISVNNLKKNLKCHSLSKIQQMVVLESSQEFSSLNTLNEFYISDKDKIQDPNRPKTNIHVEYSSPEKVSSKKYSKNDVIPGGFGLAYSERKTIKRKVFKQF